MKASKLFIQSLKNEGVEYIFGLPGEENLDFLEALRSSSIKFILTRHEQSAAFMAATYGRLTGKAGVALSTLGPGATNLVTGAAFSQLGGMPMLMITGQKPIRKSKQGHFQIISTTEILRPLTKFTKQIVSANAIPSLTREAFRIAEEERPGAVHLELPEDVAKDEAEGTSFPITNFRRPIAEEEAVAQAVELIEKAKHPLILIGAAANRKRTSNMLREFIDKTGIPFFNTQMGKGVVDEHHRLFLGTAALSSDDYIHCAIANADLIINVGHDVVEKPPFLMDKESATVIHINFFSAKVDEIYFPQLEVVGDIANAIWQIKEKIHFQPHWDNSYFIKIKNALEKHIKEKEEDSRFPLIPQRVVAEVKKIMPQDGIITFDNGMYKIWFSRNYKAAKPNTLFLDNALASMGAGLPSAIAACLVYPKKHVLAITGDGGFLMTSQELETAVRLSVNLVILVLRDDGFGMIKWKQEAMNFDSFGLNFSNPDFITLAKSYGVKGWRIEKADDLSRTISECFKKGGIHLIDVPIDYSENTRVLTNELKEKICEFI